MARPEPFSAQVNVQKRDANLWRQASVGLVDLRSSGSLSAQKKSLGALSFSANLE